MLVCVCVFVNHGSGDHVFYFLLGLAVNFIHFLSVGLVNVSHAASIRVSTLLAMDLVLTGPLDRVWENYPLWSCIEERRERRERKIRERRDLIHR